MSPKKGGKSPKSPKSPSKHAKPKIKKMEQREHILAKPGMYIGSCKVTCEDSYWVCDSGYAGDVPQAPPKSKKKKKKDKEKEIKTEEDAEEEDAAVKMEDVQQPTDAVVPAVKDPSEIMRMVFRKIAMVPGLYKLFDEILVNAADNKQRDTKDHVMTRLDVTLTKSCVTVKNNGFGISVKRHEDYPELRIPELIFGHLLTSSNFDDDIKQTVGGTHGLGAKLVNIYSVDFTIVIKDAEAQKEYRQTWRANMSVREPPVIKAYTGTRNSTSVTFHPDFERFGMGTTNEFNQDMLDLLTKRVYDIAGTTPKSLKVYLNDTLIGINSFKEYMGLYLDAARPQVVEQVHPRWQIGVSVNDTGSFEQVSFVNNIATARGGKHVDFMEELVAEALLVPIKKKFKALKDTKPADVKKHLFLFVNALIFNPTFDSQTKTFCTSTKAELRVSVDPVTKKETKDKIELPESFLKALTRSGIIAMLAERLTDRATKSMSKTDGKSFVKRITGIPKLEDANKAGTKQGYQCTLILTEGKSKQTITSASMHSFIAGLWDGDGTIEVNHTRVSVAISFATPFAESESSFFDFAVCQVTLPKRWRSLA
jgi:DNA topoisomerase-2